MNKIASRSVSIALDNFTEFYEGSGNKVYHFAFGWRKNDLIAVGQNKMDYESPKALWFAKRFNNEKQIKYPYLHAEVDLVSKMWGKFHINSSIKIVVVRVNKNGELKNSKPCDSCMNILDTLGVTRLCWSDEKGEIKFK